MTTQATLRLDDLCELVSEQVDPSLHPTATYLGLEHLASGRFRPIANGNASDVRSSKASFQAGDVLYGKLRPYLDKAVLIDQEGVCTTELLVLRPRTKADAKFLTATVHAPAFTEHAVAGTTGSQHPRTSWHHIRSFEFPAFGDCERDGIGKLLWQVHDALTGNEAVVQVGAEVKRAALREVFSKGLRGEAQKETEVGAMPESWCAAEVRTLGKVVTGNTPPTKVHENYVSGTIPFIAPGDINHGTRIRTAEKAVTTAGLLKSRPLPAGSTCFVCIGSTIGKVGMTTAEVSCTNQQINSIIPSDQFDPSYVFHLLTFWSEALKREQAPSPVPILSKGVFERLRVGVTTDRLEQQEIANIFDAIDAKIDFHRRKVAVLEELFRSLLHKLMSGEIRVADLDVSALADRPDVECAA